MSETKTQQADESLTFARTHVQPALEWWLKNRLQRVQSAAIEAAEEERSILQILEGFTKETSGEPEPPPTEWLFYRQHS